MRIGNPSLVTLETGKMGQIVTVGIVSIVLAN